MWTTCRVYDPCTSCIQINGSINSQKQGCMRTDWPGPNCCNGEVIKINRDQRSLRHICSRGNSTHKNWLFQYLRAPLCFQT
uniref:Uncharacterized protein n=1 Tax=Anguilla anguilla TaxID=7936 RepID=A0A0E9R7T7_ANGAN